jgi:hypothetical protein
MYASREGDGAYAVMKVLAVDPEAVSVRMYSNRFSDLASIDLDNLELVGLGADFLERQARGDLQVPMNIGIGHMPIDPKGFRSMKLTLVGERPVDESELEGYRYWRADSDGGTFA